MSHHPSCAPKDTDVILKCHQCGLETPAHVLAEALFEIENGGRCLAPHSGGVPCGKCHCCIARAALVKVGLKGGLT